MNLEPVLIRRRPEPEIAAAKAWLERAGLTPDAAEKVARHPTWGPVVLAPGVVVSLFSVPADAADRAAS